LRSVAGILEESQFDCVEKRNEDVLHESSKSLADLPPNHSQDSMPPLVARFKCGQAIGKHEVAAGNLK
jgi:hypothetical protein